MNMRANQPLQQLRSLLVREGTKKIGIVTQLVGNRAYVSYNGGVLDLAAIAGLTKFSRVIINENNEITGKAPSQNEIKVYVV